ncbi:Two pore calcium channel protein 1 [Takifugu flavidus]|uniref:Two pore calcium channel protein 1 n=1 Tax=Takifugu flavidus TaxID=433684 RepID=A0A5C6MV85_9TELE|nr:Two pore calcium channel protein 1 [Takifugu flavidus]
MFENGRSKEELYLASVFVSDAQYNRNIYFDTSPQAVRLYLLYNHWLPQVLLYIFIILDLSLALFEEPAVIPLPSWATMLVELLCLLVFTLRLVHYARVIPQDKFWKDPKNICIIAIVALTLIDMIIYGALKASSYQAIRWTRVLRPLLLVNVTEGRQLRRAFRSIRNALPQIIYVFLLFLFSLLIFSLMALKLVGKRDLKTTGGAPYFSSYVDIIFDLYVLVTTANSPDVMMPAYNASSWFALFFIIYILINTYIFMSVFLAVVYNNYKKYLKEEIRQLVRAKRHKMVRAFAVLQERRKDTEEQVVSQANWNQLVRLVQPDIRNAHRELLWSVLDPQNQGCIGKVAFVQLADLLNIEVITLKSRPHPLRFIFPTLYLSVPSRLICRLVRHRTFVMVYDLIILVNAIFIGLDEDNPLIADSEWMFLSLYLLEILLKLYVFEPRAFFSRHNLWNWFDTIIVFSALIATVVNSAVKSFGLYGSHQILDIVLILRVLRLVRVVDSVQRFRTIINAMIRVGPAILTFGQLILVVYYIFAMVGMELFKGKIKYFGEGSDDPTKLFCGNVLLNGTSFAQLNYCKNNFNDILSSFILLVELTVVNQWHDILHLLCEEPLLSSGFTFVTHVSARIFFVVFHIIVVIIIINIFVAFVLEAFFMEYSVEKSDLHTSVERKIEELQLSVAQEKLEDNLVNAMDSTEGNCDTAEDKPVLMFKIASKRYRTVDTLLQRMFEADLNLDDLAENDRIEADSSGNFANPAFGSV